MKSNYHQNFLLICITFMLCQQKSVSAKDSAPSGSEDKSEITKAEFVKYLDTNKLVVAKFYANWCPHCRDSTQQYEDAAKLIGKASNSKVKVIRIDCDQAKDVANKEKIDSLPTMVFYKNGKRIAKFDGDMKNAEEIAEWAAKTGDE
uniref:Thioredoxin domain-containing protein n=2 Tax=Clytia hemisphaerica TaxID=252671 RepID=A0A7M5WS10_9CNID|eukprot:TCONS_00013757-protein